MSKEKKGQGKSVFSSGKKQFISDPSSFFFFAPISPFMDHQLIQFSSMTQFDEKWKLKVEIVIKPFLTITERWLAKGIILNFD